MTAKKVKVVKDPESPIIDDMKKFVDNSVDSVDNVGTREIPPTKVQKTKSILKNTAGEEVPENDYFYKATDKGGVAPISFTKMCGYPVDREDLIEVFNKVFSSKDNFLFYKTGNKEVYLVIIPLKFSKSVGIGHESVDGDFQKHAISFIGEGSVNNDTLKMKLSRIIGFVDFDKR